MESQRERKRNNFQHLLISNSHLCHTWDSTKYSKEKERERGRERERERGREGDGERERERESEAQGVGL